MDQITNFESIGVLVDVALRLSVVSAAKVCTEEEIKEVFSVLATKEPADQQDLLATIERLTLELRRNLEVSG